MCLNPPYSATRIQLRGRDRRKLNVGLRCLAGSAFRVRLLTRGRSLRRRRLRRRNLAMLLILGLRSLSRSDRFTSYSPQFAALRQKNLDQVALRLDGCALLNDEQSHQTVGDEEQNREHRKQTSFPFWRFDRNQRRAA